MAVPDCPVCGGSSAMNRVWSSIWKGSVHEQCSEDVRAVAFSLSAEPSELDIEIGSRFRRLKLKKNREAERLITAFHARRQWAADTRDASQFRSDQYWEGLRAATVRAFFGVLRLALTAG